MVEIKICGITDEIEIEYLNILNPEYIGFVFANSKRQISGEMAFKLSSNLKKNIKKVGVFRDNSINEILNLLYKVELDIIQLHGKEDKEFIENLRKGIPSYMKIWKAMSGNDIEDINGYFNDGYCEFNKNNEKLIDKLLIDGSNPGSGEPFDLDNIEKYLNLYNKSNKNAGKEKDFFLAGGITDENVLDRISKIHPIGIDVSSGVEVIRENGTRIKSFEKMKNLIDKVRNNVNNI